MKVLVLTWEFPPFISGGLGMACYGLIKASLAKGVQFNMMLPSSEAVYFPLRNVGDVDSLPMVFFDEAKRTLASTVTQLDLADRLKAVGLTMYPESYLTPVFDFKWTVDKLLVGRQYGVEWEISRVMNYLGGTENLFKKVQSFTVMVLGNAPTLKFDMIHAHDWLAYPAGLMLKGFTRKPLIAHIHATEFDRAGGPGDERIHNIEYAGLTAADKVIAVSNYTAQMIIDRYRIDPRKIEVIHNAHTMPADVAGKRKLFKHPMILFLGRVTLQKGPDYFLKLASEVIKRHPDVRFVMAGSGDMFSKILRGAASSRLKDRFLFTGFLNRRQVEKILSATDIFVLPSVSEPFGIAPLEAMAFGAVAIVSKQSGVAEVLQNVYKIDFWDVDKTADIIIDLLGDRQKLARIAKAGQEEVMAIQWNEAAEKMVKVYGEFVCSI